VVEAVLLAVAAAEAVAVVRQGLARPTAAESIRPATAGRTVVELAGPITRVEAIRVRLAIGTTVGTSKFRSPEPKAKRKLCASGKAANVPGDRKKIGQSQG
jgi:hypothetical protein